MTVTNTALLLPNDPFTAEEQAILSRLGELSAAEKLKSFYELRHQNELSILKQDKEKNNPWDATRYAEASPFKMHLVYMQLLGESTFLSSMARYVRFQPAKRGTVPTAGVRYDIRRDEFVMEYNEAFFHWIHESLGLGGVVFILKHEMLHIVLGHCTGRARQPHNTWNISTDNIINLMCDQHGNTVPKFCIFPGRISEDVWGDVPKEINETMKTIASWNTIDDHSSEWYFNELMKNAPEEQQSPSFMIGMPGEGESGEGGAGNCKGPQGSFDAHDWDITMNADDDGNDQHNGKGAGPGEFQMEDFSEYVNEKAREMVENAVKEADNCSSSGWGSMPANLQNEIRRMVSKQVDWKTLLKQFVGKTIRGGRTTSIKRINRKYPYIHPGVKRGYVAKLVAFIDQSGSVGDTHVEMLFGELHSLSRITDIDVYPFDTRVEEEDLIKWKKGAATPTQRAYCGGTDFNAPTGHANDPKNRGRWDGMIILTDGEAPQPTTSRMRRAWILTPGRKMRFETPGETVIEMDNDGKKEFGSWK